jgi:hypothetical protein
MIDIIITIFTEKETQAPESKITVKVLVTGRLSVGSP